MSEIILDNMPASIDLDLPPFMGMGLPPEGAMLNPGPLYHNMPFMFTSFGLLAGSQVVGMAHFDAEECLKLIDRHRVEFVVLVPTMMQRIWALPEHVRNAYECRRSNSSGTWRRPARNGLSAPGSTGLAPTGFSKPWRHRRQWRLCDHRARMARQAGFSRQVHVRHATHPARGWQRGSGRRSGRSPFAAAGTGKFGYIGAEAKKDAAGGYSIGDLCHVDETAICFSPIAGRI